MKEKINDEFLNKFRKDAGNKFYVPMNHEMYGQIANMPLWQRELFERLGNQKTAEEIFREIDEIHGKISFEMHEHNCMEMYTSETDIYKMLDKIKKLKKKFGCK